MALNTTSVALVFDMPELHTTRARIVAVTTIIVAAASMTPSR
jgi:hypothetical protein